MNNKRAWLHSALIYWGVCVIVVGTASYALSQEADGTNCPSGVVGLCTPGTFESAIETVTETSETSGTGTTTTTTTTTDTTTTTVTNDATTNLLETGGGHVAGTKEGDMNKDWGGQGPGSIKNGATCGDLGTDKCAQITGTGNFTSTLGVTNTSATYKQTVNLSSFDIDRGGKTNYTIKVHKQDEDDSITMSIRGFDGNTTTFTGNDTLSAAGVASGFQTYTGGFNFSGSLTSIIVEVAGKNFNANIGPVFDDVTINVLYNVVNTIVTQTITTIEEFVALGTFDQETIDVATDIFENNNVGENDLGEFAIEPIGSSEEGSDTSYESVAAEINAEIPTTELQAPTIEMEMPVPPPVEVQASEQTVEVEIEMEMKNDINDNVASTAGPEPKAEPAQEGGANEPDTATEEPKAEPETEVSESGGEKEGPDSKSSSVDEPEESEEVEVAESKTEEKKETSKPKTKAEKKQEAKQKAATKIVKKMGDKGRYDDSNQIKTLVVMQVLGDTKSFFDNQLILQDTPGFFDNATVPDAVISDNNYGQYLMFGGSDAAHNALTESQYR